MKSLSRFNFVFLIIMSCFVVNQFAEARIEGGVSGGGGNVINPTKPTGVQDQKKIEKMISQSKPALEKYIQYKKNQFESNQMSEADTVIYSKIFSLSKNKKSTKIEDSLKLCKIKIKEKTPCYSLDHVAYDGIYLTRNKASFMCISAERLAKSVNYNNIENQTVALMMHELGEICGLTEKEAVSIQKNTLQDLK